jgi:hypothetical protein
MNRYERLKLIGPAVGTFIGVLIATFVHPFLDQSQPLGWLFLVETALLVFVLEELCRWLFEVLVLGTQWFRKLYFGDAFYEGKWIDRVIEEEPGHKIDPRTVPRYGIIEIKRFADALSYSGKNYDAAGKYIGAFQSEASELDDRTLKYMYKSTGTSEPTPNTGRGDVQFSSRNYYEGGFFDIEHKRAHRVEGKRLTLAEFNQIGSDAAIRALIDRYFPGLPGGTTVPPTRPASSGGGS